MKSTKARVAGVITLAAVASAGTFAAAPTSAQNYNVPKPITIRAVLKGKQPVYTGPSKVQRGAKLTVLNETKPKKIGPHTFSLVKPALIPDTRAEAKACGEKLEGVCGTIAFKGHKVNLEDGSVGRQSWDVGKKGWDKHFGKKGDTWVTETEDEKHTRRVTAKVGTKLTFFCAVHPNMVKKVKVVK